MRDAVIVDAVRTAVGKRNGSLATLHSATLSAHVLTALAERNHLDPAVVDDVVWGCAIGVGMQSGCIGRAAVLAAGWPESVPGLTIDRQCGSSQQAVHQAAAGVIAGQYDVAVAGGVEIMSAVPASATLADGQYGQPFGPDVWKRYDDRRFHQGVGAQMIADKYGISRTEMDQHALDSHANAARAIDEGRFKDQIAPITVTGDDGTERTFDTDEGVRRGSTLEKLGGLAPAFGEGGTLTAGNASQISDGAGALLITTSEYARAQGWTPLARIHTAVVAGTDPVTMLEGPIPATAKVLEKSGLTLDDIGVFEINEAFASVTLAWLRATGADYTKMNPNGGAMAIGHPVGGSGARIMTTLVHHMREQGVRYGLQSMCEGGGMANATILELLS
ncbi:MULTISPECIES: thiolase family protein [Rhodococcus]|jgi:acetyl-CoA acyltransferase|uniref:Acetyl-CoA acyltransferase n=1 Tax=Rhodococcus opacus RKJ300 = JCM 13270 TaxID=1165867 RepID=I0W674_RHOOP|nr:MULTISPECIES: thiolase family protein [Rhodococcus]EID71890.1 acetyl-CoA acyltransferase [Rhodococcus opacus RKJ300 = JCM 13270]QQZ14768.1 thiolase family protein [Rhodococcus sp. 21391]